MRTWILKMSVIVIATAAVMTGSASAARADERIVAKVPFAFIVGDTQLPAGDYVVERTSGEPDVLEIASADGRQFVYALTISSSDAQSADPELIFAKFSDHYFLAGVVHDGGGREIILTPLMMEHEIRLTADQSGR